MDYSHERFPAESRVRHRLHPELTGRIVGPSANFPTDRPPIYVRWDEPEEAAARLGRYSGFVFPELLEPVGDLEAWLSRCRRVLRSAVREVFGRPARSVDALREDKSPTLVFLPASRRPEIVTGLSSRECLTIRSMMKCLRDRHRRRSLDEESAASPAASSAEEAADAVRERFSESRP